MTIMHHPSLETLARFAGGGLPAGLSVAVGAHLAGCAACRAEVGRLEIAAGAMVTAMDPAPMAVDALERTFARIEAPARAAVPAVTRFRATLPDAIVVPPALRARDAGPWRWLAPGIRWSRIAVPEDKKSLVFLIRVAPNKRLPEHSHGGIELTHVLAGSFSDGFGHFGPGDTLEAGPDLEHRPVADADGECICLAAVEGSLKLSGMIGGLLRPFLST